jgi:DNA-binding transcriptional MerR regulator
VAKKEGITIAGIREYMEKFRAIKDEKERIALRTKELNEQEAYLEQGIIGKLRDEGLTSVNVDGIGSASVGEQTYPAIKDYDKALAWIIKNKRFEFLTKTIKAAPWRELYEQGAAVPGVEAYKEDVLSFRRAGAKKSD